VEALVGRVLKNVGGARAVRACWLGIARIGMAVAVNAAARRRRWYGGGMSVGGGPGAAGIVAVVR